ncbi:MAG: 5'-nucleotidase C-terminal domain-containing protein [Deltaproteobacteria bacterium]|nr:5'-nucleotidase C-terminal domain-containing protein [Deltaproteobacteria bacterium]
MHKPFVAWACLVLGGAGVGCLLEPERADGMDEPFLVDGKADGSGVEEGTATACGVLRLADTADLVRLRATVGLDRRAAEALLAYRAGPDGVEGTSDDERFDSLAELDAVRWIGPHSFARLLGHAVEAELACTEVSLSIAAFSDWHGQLEPVATASRGEVGGAAALSGYLSAERATDPSVLVLSAGDLFGASPPLSAEFGDRPAIDAANRMGFAANALGNHEFDRGLEHLAGLAQRAEFPFLAANLEGVAGNLACPARPGRVCALPYATFWLHGLKVAVVGIATPDTAGLVRPGTLGTLAITDPVAAARSAREAAAAEGACVFVALTHLEVCSEDEAGEPVGPLVDFARAATGFDVVVGGHSHRDCVRRVGGRLVVQTRDAGVDFARLELRYDFSARRVVSTRAELVPTPVSGVGPDAAMEAWLESLRLELAAVFDERLGTAEEELGGGPEGPGRFELPIGNLVADALRWRTGAQLAFTNRGGIRGVLPSSYAPVDRTLRRPGAGYAAGPPYDLVLGDVRTLLPFGNAVVTRTVTGAQLWAICEHSVETLPAPNSWFAQISGFRFTFSAARPAGNRVVSVTLDDGTPVAADDTRLTLATCDFVDQGGDGYAMLADGDSVPGETMDAALAAYLRARGSVAPRVEGRILELP